MKNLLLIFTSVFTIGFYSCNSKCKELPNTMSGQTIGTYDMGECLPYAYPDSTKIIASDSAFGKYKKDYLKLCTSASKLPTVDFSKNVLLSYITKFNACNVGLDRNITIDNSAKTYTYTIKATKCKGCQLSLTSPNWILGPIIPNGYKVIFKTVE